MPNFFGLRPKDKKKKNPIVKAAKVKMAFAILPAVAKLVIVAVIVLTVTSFVYSILHWLSDDNNSRNNAQTLYDMIGSGVTTGIDGQSLSELITIAGNENDGYYLAFKDGADERLDEIVKQFAKPDYQTITGRLAQSSGTEEEKQSFSKEILLKMIQAELYTQYPNLGGKIGNEADIKLGQDTDKQYDGGVMDIPHIYQEVTDNGIYASNAMVLSYLTEKSVTEDDVYQWWNKVIESNSNDLTGEERVLKFFSDAVQKWNAGTVMKIENQVSVKDALLSGRPVIACIEANGNYRFTKNQQYIVLTGIDDDGKVHVNNPNKEKEEGKFDLDKEIQPAVRFYLVFQSKAAVKDLQSSDTGDTKEKSLTVANDTGNGLEGFQGTIRIRRVTPNKAIGAISNTGAGNISTTENTSGSLGSQIRSYIKDNVADGNWSVYVQNLVNDDDVAKVNDNKRMESAGLINLFIMAAAYQDIKDNNTEIDKELINKMITANDDDAADQIIEQLGFTKINNYISDNGYERTILGKKMTKRRGEGDNYTCVKDVSKLLQQIYQGKCVSKNASQEMLEYLKKQTSKEKIPAGVPSDVETANKTGELSKVENDAAIVYKDGIPYVLVIMSSSLSDTKSAREHIVKISKNVYENMNGKEGNDNSGNGTTSAKNNNSGEKHIVAVVAGHGNSEGASKGWYTYGATDTTGVTNPPWEEADITPKVVNYVKQIMENKYPQFTVVTDGYSKRNEERLEIAKKKRSRNLYRCAF